MSFLQWTCEKWLSVQYLRLCHFLSHYSFVFHRVMFESLLQSIVVTNTWFWSFVHLWENAYRSLGSSQCNWTIFRFQLQLVTSVELLIPTTYCSVTWLAIIFYVDDIYKVLPISPFFPLQSSWHIKNCSIHHNCCLRIISIVKEHLTVIID